VRLLLCSRAGIGAVLMGLILLAGAQGASCRQSFIPDDSLLYALPQTVIVTATRLSVAHDRPPSPTQRFDSTAFAVLPVLSVGDILRTAAGTQVREYGLGGSQQVSIRGLGPEYTLVYVDGIRLNDAQMGIADVSLLSLAGVDRMEVARGGFSPLYGSSALGGVVDVYTSNVPRTSVTTGAGSFGWRMLRASWGAAGSTARVTLLADYEAAQNDYSFDATDGSGAVMTRENADMERLHAGMQAAVDVDGSPLILFADALFSTLGTPGPVIGATQGRARQKDGRGLLALGWEKAMTASTSLSVQVQSRLTHQEFANPDLMINGIPVHSVYDNAHVGLVAVWRERIDADIQTAAGMEVHVDRLQSAEVSGTPVRNTYAAFVSMEAAVAPVLVYPALRYDHIRNSDASSNLDLFSPTLGIVLPLSGGLQFRTRAGRNFSAPTFNQLYWREGGNPALRPEFAWALDAGLILHAALSAEITIFTHDIQDKIVWMPAGGVYWVPRNIEHVQSNGVECSVEGTAFSERYGWRINAQWLSSKKRNASFPGDETQGKQLLYVPMLSGSATLTAHLLAFLDLSVTGRVLGEQYYTESNDRHLPASAIVDASFAAHLAVQPARITLKVDMLNVLDADAETIAFFPAPGRHARASVEVSL
jgi:vitamin B12 transporter